MKHIGFYKSQNVEDPMFIDLGKGGHRQMMKVRKIRQKSWMWDHHLPENMQWKYDLFLQPRDHKTLRP